MKTKYMMSWGLAFAEKYEMKKLSKKAADGWLLEGFAFLGYNLVQGPKQELTYTLDVQPSPDKDYFYIFSSAGWTHVTSSGDWYHIFSAPKGTAPIYSGNEVEEGKYQDQTAVLGKAAIYSGIAFMVFWILMTLSKVHLKVMLYPLLVVTIICSVAFVFSFMPYVALKFKNRNK